MCLKFPIIILDPDDLTISDLYHVNVALVNAVHLWKEFGLSLGLKPPTLEIIRSNHLKDVRFCFTNVLAAWLNGEDRPHDSPGPNWKGVIAALKSPSVKMSDYADQLTQKNYYSN